MKPKTTIKFRNDLRNDVFYNTLRKRVQHYLTENHYDGYGTALTYLKALIYISLYIGLYVFLLRGALSFQLSLLVWAGLGFVGILMGLNVAHDAAHGVFFRSKQLNKIVYYLTFNALGGNAYLWQLRHIESHHLFPNVDDCDADIDDNPFIRLSPYNSLHTYQRWQWLYAPVAYLFYTLIWVFYKDFIILKKTQLANLKQIEHPKPEIILFYTAKILYLTVYIVLPVCFMSLSVGEICMGFIIMHFVSSYTFIFGLIPSHFSDKTIFPHVDTEGYLEGSWASHQIAASLDYHATEKWANFVFGGFNAHVAHHLFPNISHVHYPHISKMIAVLAKESKIPYENVSLLEAIKSHFRYLRQLSTQPIMNYQTKRTQYGG